MGEGSSRGSGRVRLFVGNRGSGRVGSTFRRVGSGPRKVTRGQLCCGMAYYIVGIKLTAKMRVNFDRSIVWHRSLLF